LPFSRCTLSPPHSPTPSSQRHRRHRHATTNRITNSGFGYDANGNMTADGNNTLVYDAENRLLSATNGGASGSYTYDGNNLRVKKVSGGTTTVYIFSGTKVIAEYDNGAVPTSPTREYIYSGAALLAKIDSSGSTYYHPDQLSNRLTTDSSGNVLAQMGHYPFGDSWYNTSSEKWLFTSYERDSESGNDYAMARSYVNRLGRFSSPDPLGGSSADPQSLNRYAYTLNDPGNLIDPLGLQQTKLYLPPLTKYDAYDPFRLIDIPVFTNVEWEYIDASPTGVVNLTTGQTLAQMGWEQDLRGIFEVGTFLGWASEFITLNLNDTSLEDRESGGGVSGVGGSNKTSQQTGPNFEANQQCQRHYLMSKYGPASRPFISAFSVFSFFSDNPGPAVKTTVALETAKFSLIFMAKVAGAAPETISGLGMALLIPTVVATLEDAEAGLACKDVSGANNPFQ
jgi:RHS repeat-associated protein